MTAGVVVRLQYIYGCIPTQFPFSLPSDAPRARFPIYIKPGKRHIARSWNVTEVSSETGQWPSVGGGTVR